MATFKNLNDLAKYVDNLVSKSLVESVAPAVKSKMQEHVEEDVYQKYQPKKYERTGDLKEDIAIEELANGVAIIPTRTDEETGKYIPAVIESGKGYSYSGYGYDYEQPRPFVENTRKELEQSNLHTEILKKSLQSKGLNIK